MILERDDDIEARTRRENKSKKINRRNETSVDEEDETAHIMTGINENERRLLIFHDAVENLVRGNGSSIIWVT